MNTLSKTVSWTLQILVAAILAYGAYAKFISAEESIATFQQLGMEPVGRYLVATLEALAALLLLFPGSVAWGAILSWGVMTGAIIAHGSHLGLTPISAAALFNWLASAAIIYLQRHKIRFLQSMFRRDSKD